MCSPVVLMPQIEKKPSEDSVINRVSAKKKKSMLTDTGGGKKPMELFECFWPKEIVMLLNHKSVVRSPWYF